TPNLVEAGHLAGVKTPRTLDEIKEAAKAIHAKGANYVVVKGGTGIEGDSAIDVFYDGTELHLLESKNFDTAFNHGAGCTFAASIGAKRSNSREPQEAVELGKAFVSSAIKNGWQMNEQVGVVRHGGYNTVEKI